MSTPLKPLPLRTFPTREGQVFRRRIDEQHSATYLYCDREPVPNSEEILYCFIVFSGAMHFRTRLTEGEIKAWGLEERRGGLDAREMSILAHTGFRKWEEAEYRAMGVVK